MLMNENEQCLSEIIETHSGLHVRGTHWDYIHSYVQKRMNELEMSFDRYSEYLSEDFTELSSLINEAAINETYFFREYRQFEYLQKFVFWKNTGNHMVIWSACCSTGEEPVSLAILAKSCNVKAKIYASDIDTSALAILQKGEYTSASFRNDGISFHHFLDQYGSYQENTYTVSDDILSSIHILEYNLASPSVLPVPENSVDIIFIRNVFIYFCKETRNRILKKLVPALKLGGIIFFSMNEIAGIDTSDLDIPLVKEHSGSIYFFRKIDSNLIGKQNKNKYKLPVLKNIQNIKKDHENLSVFSDMSPTCSVEIKGKKEFDLAQSEIISSQIIGEHILSAINRHDLHQAKYVLETSHFSPNELEFRFYFMAVIAKETGDKESAFQFFLKASLLNNSFWPAFFCLGLLYKEKGKERDAVKSFSCCAKILEKYIEKQETCYNFLVESFNPTYFYTLCNIYIEKENHHGV